MNENVENSNNLSHIAATLSGSGNTGGTGSNVGSVGSSNATVLSNININDLNNLNNANNRNTLVIENQPKRRVSIASDPANEYRHTGGFDNPAFEQNPRRKISQVSNETLFRFIPSKVLLKFFAHNQGKVVSRK